jgi:hypothetical protein
VNSTFSFLAILFNDVYEKVYVPINNNYYTHDTLQGPENSVKYEYNRITKEALIQLFKENSIYLTETDIMLYCPNNLQNTTHIHYPIFQNGWYMEEYFLRYMRSKKIELKNIKYIDVLWTNVHHEPNFHNNKDSLNKILNEKYNSLNNSSIRYFTVVQWDDGPLLNIPENTIVFGACSGTIPLPLIYEDVDFKLLNLGYNIINKIITSPKKSYSEDRKSVV